MHRGSTIMLRVTVFLIGFAILLLCVLGLPKIALNISREHMEEALWFYPALIGMYAAAVPFYMALFQVFRLLNFIDKNQAFSVCSVKSLRKIKFCAITISLIYTILMPFLYFIGVKEDAPGVILMGLIFIFASLVIAVFTAVLQKILQSAIDIKLENDLTV
ncbi:DUF2975 domain-containing protein [Marininema halotolerans]|uniref:DUF2975 domain-containing protein n=1 Tax=Marininema halotolerans TaxID=1155944 RepID=A0A1I6QMA8_9BACL|nr:DUF2975 domain-containing protein [Marininema halotolerans]SFS53530.1 Protein of unknown function [Marininema halotolerans]